MSRVPRSIAQQLIQYVKTVNVTANYWDPASKSAFEFVRQMQSPKLKKINPAFECKISLLHDDLPPTAIVEYLDGTKWTVVTSDMKANELRSEFYAKATEIEEAIEAAGGGKDDSTPVAAASKGKGGAKAAPAKPAAKK